MRIYISGPMSGDPHYKARFARVEEELKQCGFDVINPAKVTSVLPETLFEHRDYLHVDLALIDLVDVVYVLDGWRQSLGATQEVAYAQKHYKSIFYEEEMVNVIKTAR